MDVGAWLNQLGLDRYERSFREHDVDGAVLPELTAEDLAGLGVSSIGHRRRLLAAIAALRAETAPAAPRPRVPSSAERRQVTVMFCDLVGSTELSTRFDPEDLRDIIAAYHGAVANVIDECGGFIARYMGDGVLVYFGYPQAHEDDAERAVRAGLGSVDAVNRIDVKSERLQARVGIATGLVVVGDLIGVGSAQEQSIVGETPNLAARLQAMAEPNTVVIAVGTRRLLGRLFEYRDLGAVELRGIARPVPVSQVLRASVVTSRFEALRGGALSRLVGRDDEIDLLLRRWERAKAGDGQVMLVSGEAGIGKSRIAATLIERLRGEPALHVRYFCSPYHQNSALFPFVDQLGRGAGFARDDPPAVRLAKLEALATRAAPPDEDIAFLADLLSLPPSERRPLPTLDPQHKKQRAMAALLRQIEGLAQHQPVLIVFEDAHWVDPTSRELLDLLIDRVRGLSALLVVTYRPEFQPPWIGRPRVGMLALNRLDPRDRTTLVMQIAAGKLLPDEVVDQIVDRTDGVPLFVEELTKSVLESGLLREEADRYMLDRALPPFAIPTTLHDSLMARLDRMASMRQVAQVGAAIGREFSYPLLRTVSRLPPQELETALGELVASELVSLRGVPPDAVYAFKHALVQDAAHGSLLRDARQQLHARIAEALEADSPELMDSHPELFALHYAEAGLVEKSAAFWGKAGHRSAARSAMAEAAAQFHKGLDQLALLPETPERRRQELEFWSVLGAALRLVKGLAAAETGDAYARARELWEELGSPAEFIHVPYGQSRYHSARGELDLAQSLDEDLLRLSRQRNDAGGLVLGHLATGRDMMFRGRFAAARAHFEQVVALYDPVANRSLVHQATIYPDVVAEAYLGVVSLCLGFPDQALRHSSAAIAEGRKVGHPPSMAVAWYTGAIVLSLVGNDKVLGEWTDQTAAVTEQGFPVWQAIGAIFRGWIKAKNGEVAEGIALLRSGVAANRTGSALWVPYFIALLAEACEAAGQIDEALGVLDDAFEIVERTGAHWLTAELIRRKAGLLLRQGCSTAAEELYRKALDIAVEQEARLWELRAAVNLAELRPDNDDDRFRLASICEWFTEGRDIPDLASAKALLARV